MINLTIPKKKRVYIPQDLQIKWENLEVILNELLERPIGNVQELEQWLKDKSELEAALEEDFAWRYIRMSCDTANESLVKDFQYFATEIEPKISPVANKLNQKFNDSPFIDELDQDKFFVYIRAIRKALEIYREENVELLTRLQVTQQKYQGITGAMSVTLNGQEYTLEQAANFIKDTDRQVRQQAWETIQQRRMVDKDELNMLFDELIVMRHEVALNAGFENYRDYMFQALGRFDYSPQDCYHFHEAIEKQIVPILKEQAEKRAELLDIAPLKPWDMEVSTTGKPALKPFKNGGELIDKSIACFNVIDPKLGQMLSIMKANNLFDVESRKGKAPGGYNYPLAETGAPFIFMNSANSLRDLTTMVHEGGHAVHTFLTANLELNDFKHCPSEVAELASMSMELISMDNWNIYFDNEEDLIRAKKEQLVDVLKTLPWVAVIDQFQHWIYTNPSHNAADREEAFKQIYTRFGAGFANWDGQEKEFGNIWQKQLHLFEVPFYYIEYAIAQLGAIAIWKNYKENPSKALEQYLNALSLGYTKPINEIYETAGIKFDFSLSYIEQLASFVKDELQKLN
ncbi:M3 family oligoendopeptidase [Pedobacter heparinus]|uniref:Oligoendopeptidase, M3 family n=1 Tax=Pedobacter heparinus (strain ATCC 13125 / DSM 2366 / CIP 104194 / JCM 7457 / NBRC 12017 / NCIMB 9290 / NRRL B-14731 / HIM 762-3) TaxID=485917 RepID=C6Y2Y3_PEDHD|nr:M3 family oligoendopeptidase [Pedobacter heparinus]ACU03196.1 oligoendopeptidase, M3 family [Pedobacter heparinus DSM 2366]